MAKSGGVEDQSETHYPDQETVEQGEQGEHKASSWILLSPGHMSNVEHLENITSLLCPTYGIPGEKVLSNKQKHNSDGFEPLP